MLVFTLPSYDVVFKLIKDHFDFPKESTRRDVMGRYRLVFQTSADGRSSTLAIYYPGTQVESEAALIELGAGTHVDGLRFTIF